MLLLNRNVAKIAILFALAVVSLAAFAQDVPYKYQVQWEVTGDSTITFQGRKFEMEITNTTSNSNGGGGGAGKAVPGAVTLIRDIDLNTPFFLDAVATGHHYNHVVVSLGKTNHKGQFLPAVQYVFEGVVVTDFHDMAADQAVQTLKFQQSLGTIYETNELEQIGFIYSKLTIRHLDSGNITTWVPLF